MTELTEFEELAAEDEELALRYAALGLLKVPGVPSPPECEGHPILDEDD